MLAEHSTVLDPTIFRTYDIRGIAGLTLSDDDMFLIGKALGSYVQEQDKKQIVMARDGRLSSPVLAPALIEGMLSSGCDVIDIGMLPTPLLYFALNEFAVSSGVVLTGSHNPADYNGVKAMVNGKSLSAAEIQGLYQRIVDRQFSSGRGQWRSEEILEKYIEKISENIQLPRPLTIVIDAANGVAGLVAPQIFRALGCKVYELFCEVDGRFPNHHADPSQPENLQDLIKTVDMLGADIGLAFDGDGDRLGVVTNGGSIICPDRMLMLFAKNVLENNPQAKIIFDVKCTNNLAKLVTELGGEALMWKTGHSLIKAKVLETQALLAGEMSGHFFFKDRWNGYDDAIYAGARLLEIIANSDTDSESIFAAIPNSSNTPELKVPVADAEKFLLMDELISRAKFTEEHEIVTIDGLRVSFKDGWGLVRASNTTPNLIIRFEAVNETILKNIQELFRTWMLSVRPNLELPF